MRVEHQLDVAQVAGAHTVLNGLVGDAGEILLVAHHHRGKPQNIDEGVEISKVVERLVGARQRYVMLSGQRAESCRPQGTDQMTMNIDFGQSGEKLAEIHHAAVLPALGHRLR